jgi:hypothetical protein
MGTRRGKRKGRKNDNEKEEQQDEDMWSSKGNKKKKSLSGINESAAEKLFGEIADEDDANVASMEGKTILVLYLFALLKSTCSSLFFLYFCITLYISQGFFNSEKS